MYHLPPVINFDYVTDLPTCMYRLPPLLDIYAVKPALPKPASVKTGFAEMASKSCKTGMYALPPVVTNHQVETLNLPDSMYRLPPINAEQVIVTENPQTNSGEGKLERIVIKADPGQPPHGLLKFLRDILEKQGVQIRLSSHWHSSYDGVKSENLQDLFEVNLEENFTGAFLRITIIWMGSGFTDIESNIGGELIRGEINLLKYLARSFSVESEENLEKAEPLMDELYSLSRDSKKNQKEIQGILENVLKSSSKIAEYFAISLMLNR